MQTEGRVPRARTIRANQLARERIAAYVRGNFVSMRAAAETLGVPTTSVWRAVHGRAKRGPSIELCDALAEFTGRPTDYWRGRTET